MLVLSRKPQERIVFPHLGITLEILRIAGGKVRVGIEAPRDVAVLRSELESHPGSAERNSSDAGGLTGPNSAHRLRNRLHVANLGLRLLEKQLAAGMIEEAEETLAKALDVFHELDREAGRDSRRQAPKLGRRALVVDDDSNESELLAGILRLSGYEVQTAADGLEALASLEKGLPDFVLLDMNMPRCDGPTTLAAIRSNPEWRGLRVFAVSGRSQRETGVATGRIGVDRWFQKPLDPEILLGAMQDSEAAGSVRV